MKPVPPSTNAISPSGPKGIEKRKRGRPAGSKNKAKTPSTPPAMPTNASQVDLTTPSGHIEAAAAKKTRATNWSMEESCVFLELVDTEGKTWGKLLDMLHDRHLCTHISNKDQLRKHFHHLNSPTSWVNSEYVPAKFKPSSSILTQQEIVEEEREYAVKHDNIRNQIMAARATLKAINEREELMKTTEAPTETGMFENLVQKGEERKTIREQRMEKIEKGMH